jgi:aminopeptidase N
MDATQYMGLERHYNPWYATLKYTGLANRMLKSTGASWLSNYSTYMLSILEPTYNALGWTYSSEETPDEQTLRRDVVAATCNNGHELCIENAQMDWVRYKQQPDVNSINPNNLPLSLCTGVSRGTGSDWNIVFDQYQVRRGTPIRDERNSYLYGLACSKDSVTLDRLLTYIVGGVQIATRDQYRATLYLAMNPLGVDKVWNYFDNQWSTVPSGMSKFTVMRYITQVWADQASLDKLNAFIAKNPPTSQSQWSSFNQMQLTVAQNVAWMNANQDSLRDWVIAHSPAATSARSTFEFPVDPLAFWSTLRDEADEEAIRK